MAPPSPVAAEEAGAIATPGPAPEPAAIAPAALQPAERDARLAALSQSCAACRRCALAAGRQRVVVARGNPEARLMVIGEGPGAQEDEQGQPFVGRSGQLLDRMLESVGIDSNRDAYVCNIVKCRPPENRKPTALEMAACRPWLEQQIQLVDPAVILLAGATAVEGLLGIKGGITKLRGQWRQWEGRWLMPIFHPSYLLRNASKERGSPKWLTWHDLQDVQRRLAQVPGPL
ncbi:MAG: uracil-DNA glycosylase [Vulcanococcus sp.]